MKRLLIVMAIVVLAGCGPKAPPEMLTFKEQSQLFTCCNIRYQGAEITDANYATGTLIPLGTPVQINEVGPDWITFTAGEQKLTLHHTYGAKEETAETYFKKIFVGSDRTSIVAKFSPSVQEAIQQGRVQPGMTAKQVILSVGYPPTDDNPSPSSREWTYWHSKGKSYKVVLDESGTVTDVVGRPAPTRDKAR